MDLLITIAIIAITGYLALRLYHHYFGSVIKEVYQVRYGELIGNEIVYHSKTYKATTSKDGHSIVIPLLKLHRPIPTSDVMELTNGSTKILDLIKIGVGRYVYRKSNISNEVYTYKKNHEGKIVYDKLERPILIKNTWKLCDDYVEQNVKHWERLRNREIEEKHKIRSKWAEWQPLVFIGVGLLVFIMVIKFSYDVYEQHTTIMGGKMDDMLSEADELLQSVDRLTSSVTGTKEIEGADPPPP